MLRFTGKPRANMYRDAVHAKIGFWTDNGGQVINRFSVRFNEDSSIPDTITTQLVIPLWVPTMRRCCQRSRHTMTP